MVVSNLIGLSPVSLRRPHRLRGCRWRCGAVGRSLLAVRRVLKFSSGPRLAVATMVVALAIGGAGLIQPIDLHPADSGNVAATNNVAITEAAALNSTITERRHSQRSDLFLVLVVGAVVGWALPRRGEDLDDFVPVLGSFDPPILVRDRDPPWFS